MFTAKSVLLRRQKEAYAEFSKKAGLLPRIERTGVAEYGRSIRTKAVWADRKETMKSSTAALTNGMTGMSSSAVYMVTPGMASSTLGGELSSGAGLTTGSGSGIINNKINTTYNSSNVNLTYHAIEQAISRNVSIDDMIDAIDNGLLDRSIKIDCNGRRSFQRIGRRATVAIDPDNNNVTSAWPTSTKRRNRLLKALQEGQYEESEIHARTNQVTSKFRPPNSH